MMTIKFRPSNQVKNTTECVSARNQRQRGICFRSAGLTSWAQNSTSCLYYMTEQFINQSVSWPGIQPESLWVRGTFVMSETFPSSLVLSCSCHWHGLTDEQSRDFTQDRKSALRPLLPNPWPMGFSITCSHLPAQPACGLFLDHWLHSCLCSVGGKCVDQATRLP